MTTALLIILALILLTGYLHQIIKRVLIKPVAKNGVTGPEILIEKTRWDVWLEWLRPMVWGVMVGMPMGAVGCGWMVGWWE